jgi:intracellular multiplication protein IcmG
MADNDQNDEYKFDEEYGSFEENPEEHKLDSGEEQPAAIEEPPKRDMKRTGLIAAGVVVALFLGYKLITGMFSGKSNEVPKGAIPAAPGTSVPAPPPQAQSQPQFQPQPEAVPAPAQPVVVHQDNPALIQKVDAIETNQQNVQSQVSSMNEQINNINNNLNNLTAQMNKLSQAITDLTTQLNKQSEEIIVLMERTKPKPRRIIRLRPYAELNIYYINAVIPGRAWLIGTNGSTLTVREGTKIPGYGVVRLIDSMEGRVLTSSGRVIRFSQEDS